MFYFYVLYSLKDGRLYKGSTSDVGQRLLKHNSGGSPSTRHRRPFVLIYLEHYHTKKEALERERGSKTLEGGSALRLSLIEKGILKENNELNIHPSAG